MQMKCTASLKAGTYSTQRVASQASVVGTVGVTRHSTYVRRPSVALCFPLLSSRVFLLFHSFVSFFLCDWLGEEEKKKRREGRWRIRWLFHLSLPPPPPPPPPPVIISSALYRFVCLVSSFGRKSSSDEVTTCWMIWIQVISLLWINLFHITSVAVVCVNDTIADWICEADEWFSISFHFFSFRAVENESVDLALFELIDSAQLTHACWSC